MSVCNAMHAYAPTNDDNDSGARGTCRSLCWPYWWRCCCWSFQKRFYMWRCSGCCVHSCMLNDLLGVVCWLGGLGGFCVEKHKKWSTHVLGRWTQSQLQAGSGSGDNDDDDDNDERQFRYNNCVYCMHTKRQFRWQNCQFLGGNGGRLRSTERVTIYCRVGLLLLLLVVMVQAWVRLFHVLEHTMWAIQTCVPTIHQKTRGKTSQHSNNVTKHKKRR